MVKVNHTFSIEQDIFMEFEKRVGFGNVSANVELLMKQFINDTPEKHNEVELLKEKEKATEKEREINDADANGEFIIHKDVLIKNIVENEFYDNARNDYIIDYMQQNNIFHNTKPVLSKKLNQLLYYDLLNPKPESIEFKELCDGLIKQKHEPK